MFRLALDLGSAAVKVVLVDATGTLRWRGLAPAAGAPLRAAAAALDALALAHPDLSAAIAVTGRSRARLVEQLPGATAVSDGLAAAAGIGRSAADARELLLFGGQYSLWCRLDPERPGEWLDLAVSDLCAAGAGSFLEQQATRLGLTVAELAAAAGSAARAPTVAGRCAVFTKSDLIHLQQKGTPVGEIALGLCRALVRTFQAQVLQGRQLVGPVALVGGVARNVGMQRAVTEIFGLSPGALRIPPEPELVPALGAAERARAVPLALDDLRAALARAEQRRSPFTTTSPLAVELAASPTDEPHEAPLDARGEVVLGVDVGSVSTNLALVGADGRLLDSMYVPTQGRPLDAVRDALAVLRARHPPELRFEAVATTGSGRYLAGSALGADLVKNEIAAQLRAAVAFDASVDTVFEIGGQDAKYIRVARGALGDFAMNRVCAAGTGSFLEEQAARLGLDLIREFAPCALAARAPVDLGRRCTVFIESEAIAAMAAGASREDVAAGLALAVARNYLERVVADRPIGQHVVFQGGTAANRAVVAAFGTLLGRPVRVHPHHRVSGAFGVALLAQDAQRAGRLRGPSRFRGDAVGTLERSFECPRCSARCQVTRFRSGEDTFHFGDACERYTVRDEGRGELTDPLAHRTELLLAASGIEEHDPPPPDALGLLRASHTFALLPWFAALARAAGRTPYLSPPTTNATLAAGARHLASSTCLPIQAAYGHAAELGARGVTQVLLPAVETLPGEEQRSHSCLFGHHLPWMLQAAFGGLEVLAPELSLDLPPRRRVEALADAGARLGLGRRAVERALSQGDAAAARLRSELRAWGETILRAGHDRIVVVLGRPYLLSDPALNLGLGRHLARRGLPVLSHDALPLDTVTLGREWRDLPWSFARDLVRAAEVVAGDERLFPIVISSFGCGPDAFTLRHLERRWATRPHLVLELDEHRSEAGLVTRLEAFVDAIDAHLAQRRTPTAAAPTARTPLPRSARLVVPYFADHAVAQAGILRAAGFDVTLLDPPTAAVRRRGEALVSGRECHPFAMLAGDLAGWLERPEARPDDVFFFPGTVVSCLLRQYGDGLDLLLRRLGAERMRILTPSLDDWGALIGLRLTVRLQTALLATDALLRARCRVRPYELEPGRADSAYARGLARLAAAAEHGGFRRALDEMAAELAAVPRRDEPRPVVGVAGDVYTRINDFASEGLFRTLEAAGCEVWPAPFGADVAEFNATRRRQVARRLGRPRWGLRFALTAAVMARLRHGVEQRFAVVPGFRPELGVRATQELARPYLGRGANPLLVLNLGRMLRYAQAGADGVLNAACINCMVGSVSRAFEERLRGDLGHLPVSTLVFGGGDGAANQARLEAFVHQVKARAARRS